MSASFASEAPAGAYTIARKPSSLQAQATAAPWFPVEAVTTAEAPFRL